MNYNNASRTCTWVYVAMRIFMYIFGVVFFVCLVGLIVDVLSAARSEGERQRIDPAVIVALVTCFAGCLSCWIGMAVSGACHAIIAQARSILGNEVEDDGVPIPLVKLPSLVKSASGLRRAPQVAPQPASVDRPRPTREPSSTPQIQQDSTDTEDQVLGRRAGESLDAWAKRIEQAEISAFNARSRS